MIIRGTGESGDWMMVQYKTFDHAFIIIRNRFHRQLVVPEMNDYILSLAAASKESPMDVPEEEEKKANKKSWEDEDENDGIIGMLADKLLKDEDRDDAGGYAGGASAPAATLW